MGFIEDMKWWHWFLLSILLGWLLAVSNLGSDVPAVHRSMDTQTFERNVLRGPLGDKKLPWVSDVVVYPAQFVQRGESQVAMQLVLFRCIVIPDDQPQNVSVEQYTLLAPVPYEPAPRWGRLNPNEDYHYPGTTIYLGQPGDTIDIMMRRVYGKVSDEGRHAIIAANTVLRNASSWKEMQIEEGVPYVIPWNPGENHTIVDFLHEAVKSGSATNYKYAWWLEPGWVYKTWMGGSILILGIIWPLLIRLMLNGGLGRVHQSEYDLARFKGGPEKARAAKQTGMTLADMKRLDELEDQMAASLKAGAQPGDSAAAAGATPAAAAQAGPKKLTGGPLDVAAPTQQQEEHTYQGEFYPVEKTTKKKDSPNG